MQKNKLIHCTVLLLILSILLSSCANAEKKYQFSEIIMPENSANEFHTLSDSSEKALQSDFISLYIDKKTCAVSVSDSSSSYKWTSLPEKSNSSAYAFAVTLYTDGGAYKMNTQDNSVCFSSASYEIKDDALFVNYLLTVNGETAKKSVDEMTKNDIFVSFTAVYSVYEQSVKAEIDFSSVAYTKGGFIGELEFLPYLGSAYADGEKDYFLVPDGSGALMNLGVNDAETENVTVNIYGENPYNADTTDSASAIMPVFGVKRNDSAFCAVITGGDALATISASRASSSAPSAISPVFTLTEHSADENSVTAGPSYDGKISVVYKFLSGNNASYAAMASSAREEFINTGVLSSSGTDKLSALPFVLTVVGEQDSDVLTTAEQTTDILSILKSKGINNIYLNYSGLFSGGYEQKNLYTASVLNSLGGNSGLEELHGYTEKQNCVLLPSVNIFSSASSYLPSDSADTISGKNAVYNMPNSLAFDADKSSSLRTRIGEQAFNLGKEKADSSLYSPVSSYEMNLLNINRLTDKFASFLEDGIFENIDGISVSDAGTVLYSDYASTRQQARNTVSSLLRSVSNYGKLSVQGGNIYTVYGADLVTDMQFDTFYPESGSYEAVPFAQIVLHGSVLYTGRPIDAGNPLYKYEMLRCIEYGAMPGYELIYSDANIFCYSGYLMTESINDIVSFYENASEILTDLSDDTITNHKKIEKDADGNALTGVYCTTYSDGSAVYVNYTSSIVSTPDKITIGPFDYVRVAG